MFKVRPDAEDYHALVSVFGRGWYVCLLQTYKQFIIGCIMAMVAGGCFIPLAQAEVPEDRPSDELIRQELQFALPTMWTVKAVHIQDSFKAEADSGPLWKGRFRAKITTSEPTYVPAEYDLGVVTVVRPAYDVGVERSLAGRLEASRTEKGNWELAFTFDNRPTLTAGVPLRYFTGRIVVEGSEEFDAVASEIFESETEVVLKKHSAALANLRRQHDAEMQSLQAELQSLEDLEALKAPIEKRISELQAVVGRFQNSVGKAATTMAGGGIVISQWATEALGQSNKETKRFSATEVIGAPDAEGCREQGAAENTWLVLNEAKGEQSITVGFLEKVIPTEVHVHETRTTGFVKAMVLENSDSGDSYRLDVVDVLEECPGVAIFPVVGVTFPVDRITVVIDADQQGMQAVDAIQLKGIKAAR